MGHHTVHHAIDAADNAAASSSDDDRCVNYLGHHGHHKAIDAADASMPLALPPVPEFAASLVTALVTDVRAPQPAHDADEPSAESAADCYS